MRLSGELLVGDNGGRSDLLAVYATIPRAPNVPHAEVVDFVRRLNLGGRGLGWINVHLLASALVDRLRLWTADSRLSAIASELDVGYELTTALKWACW